MLEVGEGQAPAVAELMEKSGFTGVVFFKDTGGTDRVVAGRIRRT